jgi:curved DNA-binding protein
MRDDFVDYYEILQLSPSADEDTVRRVFRHLAKRYHPDNPHTGNGARFNVLLEAHEVLTDVERRAAYDLKHERRKAHQRGVVRQASADSGVLDEDQRLRADILALLYVARRQNPQHPGMGDYQIIDMLELTVDLLSFHLWYLRNKGFVERLEDGGLSLTVDGVDQVEEARRKGGGAGRKLIEKQEG